MPNKYIIYSSPEGLNSLAEGDAEVRTVTTFVTSVPLPFQVLYLTEITNNRMPFSQKQSRIT